MGSYERGVCCNVFVENFVFVCKQLLIWVYTNIVWKNCVCKNYTKYYVYVNTKMNYTSTLKLTI